MIPTISDVNHIGFVVPDLDEALDFFIETIGGELILRYPPFTGEEARGSSRWMYEQLRFPGGCTMQAGLVRLGPNMTLELYDIVDGREDQQRESPRAHDVGAPHIAFRVGDLDAAVAYLKGRGLTMHGEPQTEAGPFEGLRWIHFEAPWGLVLEVDEIPQAGLPFEAEGVRWTRPFDGWDSRR
jgi:catechol 2,3-dioxygenase-like lactoylglutathione lyase family enzyme